MSCFCTTLDNFKGQTFKIIKILFIFLKFLKINVKLEIKDDTLVIFYFENSVIFIKENKNGKNNWY